MSFLSLLRRYYGKSQWYDTVCKDYVYVRSRGLRSNELGRSVTSRGTFLSGTPTSGGFIPVFWLGMCFTYNRCWTLQTIVQEQLFGYIKIILFSIQRMNKDGLETTKIWIA